MQPHGAVALALLMLSVSLAGCAGEPAPASGQGTPAHGAGHGSPPSSAMASAILNRSTQGLPRALPSETLALANGAVLDLRADVVAHALGTPGLVRAFGFNGQIPGPTLRVPQGAHVTVRFTNHLPIPTTVHWHGLRVAAAMDGVPGISQPEVPPGGTFQYDLTFPDEGAYWYHPHVREDVAQELGLAGVILVEGPRAAADPQPREVVVVLDDALLNATDLVPFGGDEPTRTLMGRYGNRMLANGQVGWTAPAAPGERVRLVLLNAANARPFRLIVDGAAAAQWVGSDGGFFAEPRPLGAILLGPSERATLDVVMPAQGNVTLLHRVDLPFNLQRLAVLTATGRAVADVGAPEGPHARARASLAEAAAHANDPLAMTWELDARLDLSKFPAMLHAHGAPPAVEWEDAHAEMNAAATPDNVHWVIRDAATRAENDAANYTFGQGAWVNIRIRNLVASMHPMQHPIHLHGQRFVVASVDGQPNPWPVWKDTVLVPTAGEVVLTVPMDNPGRWMYHCHISEHMGDGMMGTFTVA